MEQEHKLAAKLIIEKIHLLEEAHTLLEDEITPRIFKVIDEILEEFITFEKWKGSINFTESDSSEFAPIDWQVNPNESFKYQDFYARYTLTIEDSHITDVNSSHWWLSCLTKSSKEKMIFTFYPWFANFNISNKKAWKNFALEFQKNHNTKMDELEIIGFKYIASEVGWFLPIEGIEASKLAQAYFDDELNDVLAPIKDALEKIKEAHPIFEEFIQSAKISLNS